jgi:hypothetical protein
VSTTSTIVPLLPSVLSMIYRISTDEYERMIEARALEDPRIELLGGLLVKKVPKNPPRVLATIKLALSLGRIMPQAWHIRKEDPVRIPMYDEPEPDLAVVAGLPEDYGARHPEPANVALLVEVAESTLDRDPSREARRLRHGRHSGLMGHQPGGASSRGVFPAGTGQISGARGLCPRQAVPVVIAGTECGPLAVSDLLP